MFVSGAFHFHEICRKIKEPTSGLEPLTPAPATSDHSGVAGGCKSCIDKPTSFLSFAQCCTVLRSRWYQIGIRTRPRLNLTPLGIDTIRYPRYILYGHGERDYRYTPSASRSVFCDGARPSLVQAAPWSGPTGRDLSPPVLYRCYPSTNACLALPLLLDLEQERAVLNAHHIDLC